MSNTRRPARTNEARRRAENDAVRAQTYLVARQLDAKPDLYADAQNPYRAAALDAGLRPDANPAVWAAVERKLDEQYGCR